MLGRFGTCSNNSPNKQSVSANENISTSENAKKWKSQDVTTYRSQRVDSSFLRKQCCQLWLFLLVFIILLSTNYYSSDISHVRSRSSGTLTLAPDRLVEKEC